MNAIRIKTAKEFATLLDSLTYDCAWARTIFRQRVGLRLELSANLKVFDVARNFWTLTLYAHDDSVLARLCRIYDQHRTSLNLRRLLLTIQDNLPMFDQAQFRARNKNDPFVETLAVNARRPDANQLAEDIAETSATDPLVEKLHAWRNQYFAHTDPRPIIANTPPDTNLPLTQAEVQTLLERANKILFNRYRKLFKGSIMVGILPGLGDYSRLLNALKANVK